MSDNAAIITASIAAILTPGASPDHQGQEKTMTSHPSRSRRTMSNHPNRRGNFELVFAGSAMAQKFPRVRRFWPTYEAAAERATVVLSSLDNRAAHPAIVYGPGCGRDGTTIR